MARLFHRFDCPCCDPVITRRREVIRAGLGGLVAMAVVPVAAQAQGAAAGGARSIRIRRVQTGESFDGIYWRDGRYERDALRQLDVLFRDPSMDETTPMDPRLFDVLFTVARHLGSDDFYEVISGYRAPETNAARAQQSRRVSRVSLHMSGMAADVRLPGRQSMGIARTAADMQIGGVGLYRRDGFVHLDCGPARRW
ncbi:MAG TPA: DUF882 domain-containing protein [Roseomonas sp.]|nr:DUF882 domain-containing protein [Roseomonas sp.]